jgi:xanthine dehydrogenase accessory factor
VSIFDRLAQLEKERKPVALATIIQANGSVPRHEGSKMLIFPSGSFEGSIGGGEVENLVIRAGQEALMDGKTRLLHYNFSDPERGDPGVCGGEMDVYIEPIRPNASLLIFGMGHVGKAVAHLGSWLGFRVIAADDREEHLTEEDIPEADQRIQCEIADLQKHVELTDQTFIVLTTRGVNIDVAGLPALLNSPAAYIGVIGSRRRWETTVHQLQEMGIPEEAILRVTSPMGLEIHAETPEEIALSILAEIVMIQRGGTGEKMTHVPVKLKNVDGD